MAILYSWTDSYCHLHVQNVRENRRIEGESIAHHWSQIYPDNNDSCKHYSLLDPDLLLDGRLLQRLHSKNFAPRHHQRRIDLPLGGHFSNQRPMYSETHAVPHHFRLLRFTPKPSSTVLFLDSLFLLYRRPQLGRRTNFQTGPREDIGNSRVHGGEAFKDRNHLEGGERPRRTRRAKESPLERIIEEDFVKAEELDETSGDFVVGFANPFDFGDRLMVPRMELPEFKRRVTSEMVVGVCDRFSEAIWRCIAFVYAIIFRNKRFEHLQDLSFEERSEGSTKQCAETA